MLIILIFILFVVFFVMCCLSKLFFGFWDIVIGIVLLCINVKNKMKSINYLSRRWNLSDGIVEKVLKFY